MTSVTAMSTEGIIDDGNDRCSGHHTPFNGWLSPKMRQSSCYPPPLLTRLLLLERGGARISLDRTAGGGWPFPSFSSSSSSFSFSSFSSIVAGPFEAMKMTTEEELAAAAAAVAAAPEAAPQSSPQ